MHHYINHSNYWVVVFQITALWLFLIIWIFNFLMHLNRNVIISFELKSKKTHLKASYYKKNSKKHFSSKKPLFTSMFTSMFNDAISLNKTIYINKVNITFLYRYFNWKNKSRFPKRFCTFSSLKTFLHKKNFFNCMHESISKKLNVLMFKYLT